MNSNGRSNPNAWRLRPLRGPTASGPPGVSPGVVFSAARATCVGASWHGGTVTTQWLLDGAPIAGASAAHVRAAAQLRRACARLPPDRDRGRRLELADQRRRGWSTSSRRSPRGRSRRHRFTARARSACSRGRPPARSDRPTRRKAPGGAPSRSGASRRRGRAPWGPRPSRPCARWPKRTPCGSLCSASAPAASSTLASRNCQPRGAARSARRQPDAVRGRDRRAVRRAAVRRGRTLERALPRRGRPPELVRAGRRPLAYGVAGAPAPPAPSSSPTRSRAADLGARLRCVAGADDGPAAAPTKASFASTEYGVASAARCGPRRLGAASLPQPAIVVAGEPRCVPAPLRSPRSGQPPRSRREGLPCRGRARPAPCTAAAAASSRYAPSSAEADRARPRHRARRERRVRVSRCGSAPRQARAAGGGHPRPRGERPARSRGTVRAPGERAARRRRLSWGGPGVRGRARVAHDPAHAPQPALGIGAPSAP